MRSISAVVNEHEHPVSALRFSKKQCFMNYTSECWWWPGPSTSVPRNERGDHTHTIIFLWDQSLLTSTFQCPVSALRFSKKQCSMNRISECWQWPGPSTNVPRNRLGGPHTYYCILWDQSLLSSILINVLSQHLDFPRSSVPWTVLPNADGGRVRSQMSHGTEWGDQRQDIAEMGSNHLMRQPLS